MITTYKSTKTSTISIPHKIMNNKNILKRESLMKQRKDPNYAK